MVQYPLKMGQNSSLPKGRRKSLRSFTRKSVSKKTSLSHTFTINENDDKIYQLNINIASEEELMTLDGVNREIAKSIVEHRKAIGRFRKIEDLAVVRGIGADKLQHLRPEICISSRRSLSSSRAQSIDSLRSTESRLTLKTNRLVNINKATIFELQAVNGITQEIAAAIIHHRTKKGYFSQVDDLIKIKTIDWLLLNNISRYLVAEDESPTSIIDESRPTILTNGFTNLNQNGRCNGFPRRIPITNGLTNSSAADIFELLSAYSPRPIISEIFKFTRNDESAVRLASWNLHEFSYEKASNLGVREVICRTIVENGFSIIALQDIVSVAALRNICDELNNPKLQRVKEWSDAKHHNWNFCMLDVKDSKLGFLYDSDGAIAIDLVSLNEGPAETKNECEALVASFRVESLTLQLVNLMLNQNTSIEELNKQFEELTSADDNLIVFVDFSNIKEITADHLSMGNLKPVFDQNRSTTFATNPLQKDAHHTSNIHFNQRVQGQLTGMNGVIKQGLVHLAIPNGWSWGGPVSPYCPIYIEIYVNSILDTSL